MAVIVPRAADHATHPTTFDWAALYQHLDGALASFASPLFLRVVDHSRLDITGTFKYRKMDLVADGFDVTRLRDVIYFRDDAQRVFVPLDATLYHRILSGEVRL